MIRKLRKKFISITAGALFAVILLVLAAVNGIFFFQSDRHLNQRLDGMMDQLLSPPPGGQENPGTDPLPQGPRDTPPWPREDTEEGPQPAALGNFPPADRIPGLLIRADGCVICLDRDGNILEIRQDGAQNYTEEELADIAAYLLKSGRSRGWHQYFKFRVEYNRQGDGAAAHVIGLINASSDLYAVFNMLLISAVIGIAGFLLALLIIVLASGRAVKPIAESYARQRQFVTDAGHELKTPLTVISSSNELARIIYGDSEWFDSIDRQTGRMNGLVRSLITLAKMDEEQKPVFTSFSLSDAVYDTAGSFKGLLHSQGKRLTLDIAENMEYTGDESRIRQMVSILMDNAAKYCDSQGTVSVRLSRDKRIRLTVLNDFAAVDNCELDKLFERFYRADKARTPDGSYGLGLSIAKSVVELHKGEIRAKAPDHGHILFEIIL